MRRFLLAAVAAAIVALLCPAAQAVESWSSMEDHPRPSSAPDPYRGIKNFEGYGCCNGDDCKRVKHEEDFVVKVSGGYIVKETNEFVPEKKVAYSPDGNWHLCRYESIPERVEREKAGIPRPRNAKGEELTPVRCIMIPPGGS